MELKCSIKITQKEKRLVKKIHQLYLPQENFSFIKLTFYTWLTDDFSIIYLNKNPDKTWNYVLADARNPYTNRIIVDMSILLNSN